MTQTIYTTIDLRGLEFNVHLGWSETERQAIQTIVIDLFLRFKEPPTACHTDQLADTCCYATLTNKIDHYLQGRPFHLLERVGHDIYQLIKPTLTSDILLSIRVFKHPPLAKISKGVSFSYGDEQHPW